MPKTIGISWRKDTGISRDLNLRCALVFLGQGMTDELTDSIKMVCPLFPGASRTLGVQLGFEYGHAPAIGRA